tara:strand:- start:743 stop:901 length:159 start_codon:yes stop_codon:yes gene_type:complete
MNDQLQLEASVIFDVLEDTVSHICNENMLSGEKVWVIIRAVADAQINQFPDY